MISLLHLCDFCHLQVNNLSFPRAVHHTNPVCISRATFSQGHVQEKGRVTQRSGPKRCSCDLDVRSQEVVTWPRRQVPGGDHVTLWTPVQVSLVSADWSRFHRGVGCGRRGAMHLLGLWKYVHWVGAIVGLVGRVRVGLACLEKVLLLYVVPGACKWRSPVIVRFGKIVK